MKGLIRTDYSDAAQSENRRIEVTAQPGPQPVMQQHRTSVNFARFAAFVRCCRIESAQSQRRDRLAVPLRLEPGEDDRLVAEDVLHRAQPALRRPQPVEVAALHHGTDALVELHPFPGLGELLLRPLREVAADAE